MSRSGIGRNTYKGNNFLQNRRFLEQRTHHEESCAIALGVQKTEGFEGQLDPKLGIQKGEHGRRD